MQKKKIEVKEVEQELEETVDDCRVREKVYVVPETKEDYLRLHKLLKDIGVNSIGDLEVKASRL
jgi:hypothetical protein